MFMLTWPAGSAFTEGNLDVIAASIVVICRMQWLMNITHKVHDDSQREQSLRRVGASICKDLVVVGQSL